MIIIRGDHYNETLLKKVNINYAKKVLILSDQSLSDSGVGVDSLTVLTAMTIRSISLNVSITAELTDIKFEKYLHNAHVDEIIYTNEYSNSLLATSLHQVGLTKIINDLLIKHQTAHMTTEYIPVQYHLKKYKELKEFYQSRDGTLVIGLLENVGNLNERKQEAIRTAQKTADVTLLINNLKNAKNIENNQSHLLPDDDYAIPANSLAILIKKNELNHQ